MLLDSRAEGDPADLWCPQGQGSVGDDVGGTDPDHGLRQRHSAWTALPMTHAGRLARCYRLERAQRKGTPDMSGFERSAPTSSGTRAWSPRRRGATGLVVPAVF